MHFPHQKCVFIHVPKTGGNFFTHCFLRYSSDDIVTRGHQDGNDRFELNGGATTSKHQSLAEYSANLGESFSGYRAYAFVRPPLERMISLYYSPNRWMREREDGSFGSEARDEPVNLRDFKHLIRDNPSISDVVDAKNVPGDLIVKNPAVHSSGAQLTLLDFSDLQAGITRFAAENGFDLDDMPAKKVNSSAVRDPLALNKDQMGSLKEIVMASHHADDLRFFGNGRPRRFLDKVKPNLAHLSRGRA